VARPHELLYQNRSAAAAENTRHVIAHLALVEEALGPRQRRVEVPPLVADAAQRVPVVAARQHAREAAAAAAAAAATTAPCVAARRAVSELAGSSA